MCGGGGRGLEGMIGFFMSGVETDRLCSFSAELVFVSFIRIFVGKLADFGAGMKSLLFFFSNMLRSLVSSYC